MERMNTVSNSDGDFFTLVQVNDVHTLIVYENKSQTVFSTMMRYIPKSEIWMEVTRQHDGKVEISEINGKLGKNIVADWNDLQKYADELVNM